MEEDKKIEFEVGSVDLRNFLFKQNQRNTREEVRILEDNDISYIIIYPGMKNYNKYKIMEELTCKEAID